MILGLGTQLNQNGGVTRHALSKRILNNLYEHYSTAVDTNDSQIEGIICQSWENTMESFNLNL